MQEKILDQLHLHGSSSTSHKALSGISISGSNTYINVANTRISPLRSGAIVVMIRSGDIAIRGGP